jgi:hypothetical protein
VASKKTNIIFTDGHPTLAVQSQEKPWPTDWLKVRVSHHHEKLSKLNLHKYKS